MYRNWFVSIVAKLQALCNQLVTDVNIFQLGFLNSTQALLMSVLFACFDPAVPVLLGQGVCWHLACWVLPAQGPAAGPLLS